MKRFYVAKGETVELSELHTELVIVEGALKIIGKLTAKHIQGHGYLEAEEVLCGTSSVNSIRAQTVTAQKIATCNLLVRDCRADEIGVAGFFEALHVQAGKLTLSRSRLELCEVTEVITLPDKKRGLLGMLLASWWRSLWLPGKPPQKAEKPRTDKPQKNAAKPEAHEQQPPVLTTELLAALVSELEKQGFVRAEPPAPQFVEFEKGDAA